jgi:hypothetical protein
LHQQNYGEAASGVSSMSLPGASTRLEPIVASFPGMFPPRDSYPHGHRQIIFIAIHFYWRACRGHDAEVEMIS